MDDITRPAYFPVFIRFFAYESVRTWEKLSDADVLGQRMAASTRNVGGLHGGHVRVSPHGGVAARSARSATAVVLHTRGSALALFSPRGCRRTPRRHG